MLGSCRENMSINFKQPNNERANMSKKKGRKSAPEGENKLQRFERLATQRVDKVIKQLQLLGNLAGANYEHTEVHIKAIMDCLANEMADLQGRFTQPDTREHETFSFEDWTTDVDESFETVVHTDETA